MELDANLIIQNLKQKLADALVDAAVKEAQVHQLRQELANQKEVTE
ncbi:hypothetical protein [Bacillus pseudomycoides]|nr:hypothetical protein [Bacillus pseudomycoides]